MNCYDNYYFEYIHFEFDVSNNAIINVTTEHVYRRVISHLLLTISKHLGTEQTSRSGFEKGKLPTV